MLKIYTVANKRPDFIKYQLFTIKKYIKNIKFEYVVLNNAIFDEELKEQINKECKKLNVKCIEVYGEHALGDYSSLNDPSRCALYALNFLFKKVIEIEDTNNIISIIDSDMFFIEDIDISILMNKYDIIYTPQYRGKDVEYMWTGFFIINCNKINLKDIDLSMGYIDDKQTDVGGFTHYFLRNNGHLNVLYLEFWNLTDIELNDDTRLFKTHLNGNIYVEFSVDNNDNIIDYKEFDEKEFNNKYFKYEKNRTNYKKYYTDNFMKIEKKLSINNFPHPICVDFIKTMHQDINKSFIIHYKSGSNYQNFQNDEYNKKKTLSLINIIDYKK